jgi:hypothetical protein
MENKKYIIKDLYHHRNAVQYVNEDTESLETIWRTIWPKNKEKDEDYKPKVFPTKTEAKRYLTEVKRQSRIDWKENSYIHKQFGLRQPIWDIYELQS